MGDVLSQNEIDNLLSALNSGEFDPDEAGETDDRQIKDYDFARPSKFSKEHLRTLEFIFEHYARLLSTNVPTFLFEFFVNLLHFWEYRLQFSVQCCIMKCGIYGL